MDRTLASFQHLMDLHDIQHDAARLPPCKEPPSRDRMVLSLDQSHRAHPVSGR